MTLHEWEENGWLKRHEASPGEIENLLGIVERELRDATVEGISLDAKLGMLYNATLKLADVALRRAGYRATGSRHHYYVSNSIPLTMGDEWTRETRFLAEIQKLRHRADYESVGVATEIQVTELREIVERLQQAIK